MTAAVPVPADVLARSRVELDVGCVTFRAIAPLPIFGPGVSAAYLNPAHNVSGYVDVVPLSKTWSQVRLELSLPLELSTGSQRYRLRIDDETGRNVLDVARWMSSGKPFTDRFGPNCGHPCAQVVMRVYPKSKSDRSCSGNRCDSGLRMHVHAPGLIGQLSDGEARICRNGACAVVSLQVLPKAKALAATVRIRPSRAALGMAGTTVHYSPSRPDELLIRASTDPIVLNDGDEYVVELADGEKMVARFTETVRYLNSFPNACDDVPCKQAVVHR